MSKWKIIKVSYYARCDWSVTVLVSGYVNTVMTLQPEITTNLRHQGMCLRRRQTLRRTWRRYVCLVFYQILCHSIWKPLMICISGNSPRRCVVHHLAWKAERRMLAHILNFAEILWTRLSVHPTYILGTVDSQNYWQSRSMYHRQSWMVSNF